jgi:hypothetical protein
MENKSTQADLDMRFTRARVRHRVGRATHPTWFQPRLPIWRRGSRT